MSTNLELFLPYVLPFAPGASEPTCEAQLLAAAIDFCSKTRIWRDWLQPIDVLTGNAYVTPMLPADATIFEIEQMWLNREELRPRTEDDLRCAKVQPGDVGAPWFYTSSGPGQIILMPTPAQDYLQALRLRVSLLPSRDATTLPDFLYNQYATEIADGALMRLHSSGEAYAVAAKGLFFQSKFDAAIDRTTTQAASSNLKARRRARAHFM